MTIRKKKKKKQLADDMVQFIAPLSEKINMLKNDDAYINKVIAMGKEKAAISANKTINEVRNIIGFK